MGVCFSVVRASACARAGVCAYGCVVQCITPVCIKTYIVVDVTNIKCLITTERVH